MPKSTTESSPEITLSSWVFFETDYGDFPQYKKGDLVKDPTPELLATARQSNCFSVIEPADQPAYLIR